MNIYYGELKKKGGTSSWSKSHTNRSRDKNANLKRFYLEV